jgi:hypothetical protein
MSLSHDDQGVVASAVPLLRKVDTARDKAIAGWLRIAFFAAILFSHTVQVPLEFPEGRDAVAWALLLRDFGAAGFFLLAGASLQAKRLERGPVTLPSNLLKLVVAAAALAAFDIAFTVAKGGSPRPVTEHFYTALYDTNLWFFVAYAFAGPLLLSLDRRGVWLTAACCLLLVAFPASYPLLSPYILQTISLAFVWMAIGAALYGYRGRVDVTLAIAAAALAGRLLIDDGGPPGGAAYPALDVVLRIVYGVACFLLLKSLADVIVRRSRSPGWSNDLFIPYIVQFPLILVVKVALTPLFIGSFNIRMPPIFASIEGTLSFMASLFGATLVASFALAAFLRRYKIRV